MFQRKYGAIPTNRFHQSSNRARKKIIPQSIEVAKNSQPSEEDDRSCGKKEEVRAVGTHESGTLRSEVAASSANEMSERAEKASKKGKKSQKYA